MQGIIIMVGIYPNLFIIGAMKSGTTSLHRYLAGHPQIFMCEPKEPMYFSRESNWSQGIERYLELFAAAGNAEIIGESSTEYTKLPRITGVPQRIAEFNPESRFIYIMRDPIERTLSHYWHMWRHHDERRDILTAIREEPEYLNVSYYAMQLRPYIELFELQRIKIITLEALQAAPLHVVQGIYAWLGVDSSYRPPTLNERANTRPERLKEAQNGFNLLYHFHHTPFWRKIRGVVPQFLRTSVKKIAVKEVDPTEASTSEVVDYLRSIQINQTQILSDMLECTFPEWTTLWGTMVTSSIEPEKQEL